MFRWLARVYRKAKSCPNYTFGAEGNGSSLGQTRSQRVQLRGGTLHLYVASYEHCDPVAGECAVLGRRTQLVTGRRHPLILQRLHPDGADHDRRFFMFYSSVSMKPRTSLLTVNSPSFEDGPDALAGLGTRMLVSSEGRGGRPRDLCERGRCGRRGRPSREL